jgi:PAS domain-containing protein/two-component sensor histidine kinase
MASAPSDPRPVLGRVDRDGRLIAADPDLERLQVEAGSSVGASLALPQLAAVVRVAQRLRIPVSRRILAAGREQDVDMWVRAVPEDGEVAIAIEQWSARPASPPRLATAVEHERLAVTPLSWSVDEQLRIVTIAPALAEQLSLDPAEAIGQPLTKVFRLEEEQGEMPLLAALASRSGFAGQRVTTRDGASQLILSGEASLRPDGAFAGFDGSAEAPDNDPPVDSALHTALRSPLDSIVRSAEQMIDRSGGPLREEYAAYASDIAAAARHLLSVVRSLGEQGEASGASQIDLAELTSEAAGLIESAASERGIVIAIQPVESFMALGESRSITQILVNLIGNAVRYTREGTAVTISFEKAGGSALIHVADEGPGIDRADHERIFEPFQQGGGGSEGTGLGLAIARRLARSMGGDIRLLSAPGNGARFTLELPAA